LPLLQKIKTVYLIWYNYYHLLPKIHRHTLGQKIDNLFVEIIEAVSIATFLSKGEKQPYVWLATRKLDTVKVLLMILWETKSLDDKKYLALSAPLSEIGKMLGGWNGQITKSISSADKQNSPAKVGEK
jgi:hypothetical protein